MHIKKIILLGAFYLLFLGVLFLSSNTLTRFFTNKEAEGSFDIGKKLYFEYERGELYRNKQLIVGVEIEEPKLDENGNVISILRRIETMNVIPGDTLEYHFYIRNYNITTEEANGIDGVFNAFGTSLLAMPVKGDTYDLACTMSYREINKDNKPVTEAFTSFSSDKDEDLPIYDKSAESPVYKCFEFVVEVKLDDQITSTSKDDYFGATLSIYLSIVAANKVKS